jgi:hypothetical protein
MTEEEWLTGSDPKSMLLCLLSKGSDRKLRLFACACCYRVWDLITEVPDRKAVETSLLYADNLVSVEELADATHAAERPHQSPCKGAALSASSISDFPAATSWLAAINAAECAVVCAAKKAPRSPGGALKSAARSAERKEQAILIRDIFGDPFRPVTLDSTWRTATVVQLAQALYDARNFADMPILADALEESGCTSRELLDHLRGPGPHVLGCWAMDLVLNKG